MDYLVNTYIYICNVYNKYMLNLVISLGLNSFHVLYWNVRLLLLGKSYMF